MNKPYVLLTNDDGIHAPGLKHLWNALHGQIDMIIVAPASEQSCVGLGVTIRDPLHITQVQWPGDTPAWSVSGTPADCIRMALGVILPNRPTLVLSGINRGSNGGRNVLYSGTVGGTVEAALQGLPGIAFSHADYFEPDYAALEKYIPLILNELNENPLPPGTLLNVNYPSREWGEVKGIKLARQGLGYWGENPNRREHPSEGHSYYWMGAQFKTFDEDPEGDIHLLHNGYVTAVPIHISQLTDHNHWSNYKSIFEERVNDQILACAKMD